jgi:catechol 2,3-dioxygenase-like lactoylglutathione lyase family enzyme
MVYSRDAQRALAFYRDLLGFRLVDEFRHEDKPVYARLRSPDAFGNLTRPHRGCLIWPHLRHKNPFPPAC